jgi:hypothetical protein
MKWFVVVALLLVAGASEAKELFKYVSDDGSIYMVKTRKDKSSMYWYQNGQRCIAAHVKDGLILVSCPNEPDFSAYSDDGDVVAVFKDGSRIIFADITVFAGMYRAVVSRPSR